MMNDNIDFLEVLCDHINSLGLSIDARLDYLGEEEDLVLYPLPGGTVETEDMAGTMTVQLPYEVAIKTKDQQLNNVISWLINSALSKIDLELPSKNHTYNFLSLEPAAPALNDLDEQGFYIYLLDITARLEIERKN